MLDFLKQKQGANALVDQLARETASYRGYPVGLTHYSAGRQILESHPDVQAQAALAIVAWFRSRQEQTDNMHLWSMRYALFELLGRGLPLTETDLLRLLDWSVGQSHGYMKGIPQMTKCCAAYLKGNPLTEPLREKIENLIESSIRGDQTAESRRWILQLQELIGDTRAQLLLESADVWANTALHEIGALVAEKQAAWAELLLCCLRKSGSSPSPKWIENNVKLVDIIGRNDFFEALLRWFPLANQPREALFGRFDNGEFLRPVNADLLRGLVWLASQSGTPEIARSVSALAISAYRKVPGRGPRTAKVGNACFWALGNMPGTEGVSQLSILKAKIKTNSAQKVITNTLAGVASRIGMIPEEFEEQFVPSYGLDDVGLARIKLGDLTCEIRVDGVNVTQNWSRAGKQLSSPSKQSREQFAEKLKEITQSVKDLRRMLPAQRDRIENLYLQQR
ncbi:MAG TPA: hypothetical protein VMC62_01855, partial [Longilinea sp.]|nr:hypothetical protein [Longilinea sp.]